MGKKTYIGDSIASLHESNDGSQWIVIENDDNAISVGDKEDAYLFSVFKTLIEERQ